MKISRRSFIKVLAAGTFSVASGIGVSDILQPIPSNSIITEPQNYIKVVDGWIIDTAKKTIKYSGDIEQDSFHLMDLYRKVMDTFDEPDMMEFHAPMSRATDTIFNMEDEWQIEPSSIQVLNGACLIDKHRGNIWSHVQAIGPPIDDETEITVIQEGKPIIQGHCKKPEEDGYVRFETIVQIEKEKERIDDGTLTFRARHKNQKYFSEHRSQCALGTNVYPVYVPPFFKG